MRQEPTLDPPPTLRAEPRPTAPVRRASRRPGRWIAAVVACLLLSPLVMIVALRWLPPPTSAYMLQSPVKPVRYQWVPASSIADVARRAVIAAEDQKFRMHHGFDVEAIERAVEHNKRSRQRRGASTISQQTAKNLFLWPGGGYFRKALEAGLTVAIEQLWGKDRILEMYLNVAEFGLGIYGVEAAAQAFFGKHAGQLSAAEAARLAAVLPNPRRWSARAPGPYVQSRTAWILGQMGFGSRGAPAEEPEFEPSSEEPAPEDDAFAAPLAPEAAAPPELAPAEEGTVPAEPAPITAEAPAPDAPATEAPTPEAPAPNESAPPEPAPP